MPTSSFQLMPDIHAVPDCRIVCFVGYEIDYIEHCGCLAIGNEGGCPGCHIHYHPLIQLVTPGVPGIMAG